MSKSEHSQHCLQMASLHSACRPWAQGRWNAGFFYDLFSCYTNRHRPPEPATSTVATTCSCCLPWVSRVPCELHYMKITVFMCFPESPREELEEPKAVYFRLMRKQILRTSVLILAQSCVADCSFLENVAPSGC